MKLALTVNAEGETTEDLVAALDRVTELLSTEFTSGMDRNETSAFTFQVSEPPKPLPADYAETAE